MVAGPEGLALETLPAIRVDGVHLSETVLVCHAPHIARRRGLTHPQLLSMLLQCSVSGINPLAVQRLDMPLWNRGCITAWRLHWRVSQQPAGCAEPAAGSIQYEEHLLDSAPSPLVRALPAYERDFRGHLLRARRLWEASQRRLRDAEQLLSELVRPVRGACGLLEGGCQHTRFIAS